LTKFFFFAWFNFSLNQNFNGHDKSSRKSELSSRAISDRGHPRFLLLLLVTFLCDCLRCVWTLKLTSTTKKGHENEKQTNGFSYSHRPPPWLFHPIRGTLPTLLSDYTARPTRSQKSKR